MALRNQPYIPLYVQDIMTDEKLNECCAATHGVYIKGIMCLMHKSETYGKILLRQKYKQNESKEKNFAVMFATHFPYSVDTIFAAITELILEGVCHFEDDYLVQKRMVKDGEISITRSLSGKKGGNITKNNKVFAIAKDAANAIAKDAANTEYEYEYYNSITKEEKLEKMIVKEMMSVWMKVKQRYKLEEGLDFSACLEIAFRIGNDLGIEKSKIVLLGDTTNLNDVLILQKWEEYINFIITDNFFDKLTVSSIANKKNWHSIQNAIVHKPNEDKERLLESKRITPEEYFKN